MMKRFKTLALGALAAAGITTAAYAQQPTTSQQPNERQMDRQMIGQSGSMGMMDMMQMMNDPAMRKQMTEMMTNCNRMMERMNSMPERSRSGS